jgi:carbamoyltransferase
VLAATTLLVTRNARTTAAPQTKKVLELAMTKPRVILGIGGALGHDANAALIVDGRLISASQEERFTRIKHEWNFPRLAILDCLKSADLQPEQVEICAFAEKPLQSLIFDQLGRPTNRISWLLARFAKDEWFYEPSPDEAQQWWTMSYPREARRMFPKARFDFAWHHLSHAWAAFATSPFERAAFLCVDGKGEDISASIGTASAQGAEILYELPYENGLGLLYTLVSCYLGFDSFGSEYKVMGLAPYGEPTFAQQLRDFAKSDANGALRLTRHANFTLQSMRNSINALERHLSLPARKKAEPLSGDHINIAASLQVIFEEEVLKMARFAREITGCTDLLFCGGCAQNCVAAGEIRRSGIFNRVYTSPVSGDMGSSLGAALLLHQKLNGRGDGKINTNGFYLGGEPGQPPLEALQHRVALDGGVHKAAANLLAEGKVIGWARGRMELGARALGARSILADPRVPNMQSVLNLKIKFRESFRPFAPAILAEDCGEWFDTEEPSDYMQYTAYLLPKHRHSVPMGLRSLSERLHFPRCSLPSVVHVDNSARLQTVRRSVHPDFHELISEFKRLTGIPMIINTSFNVSGQPIVRTAEEAWQCFRHTDIDYLVLNDAIFRNPIDKTREEKTLWARQFEKYS